MDKDLAEETIRQMKASLALIRGWAHVDHKNPSSDSLLGRLVMIEHEAKKAEAAPGPLSFKRWCRVVKIRCPQCQIEQGAEEAFYESDPFPTHVHQCVECGYTIGESEWDYASTGEEHEKC